MRSTSLRRVFIVEAGLLLLICLCLIASTALAASPYIAYVYPAGGQRGTTVLVTIGGQRLKGLSAQAEVTGNGVKATVVGYVPSGGPLNQAQQDELRLQIDNLIKRKQGKSVTVTPSTVKLPDLPDLRNLARNTIAQLNEIKDKYLNRSRRPVAPMAEEITLQIEIDSQAAVGNREIRLLTANGLSNPVIFQVSSLPEVGEPAAALDKPGNRISTSAQSLPRVLNGQIMPGDVDQFPLLLEKGQQIMAVGYARELVPYLADAVPGWFQATLALYDPWGKEVAFADDCGFDPDPVLLYTVPTSGQYMLEIRDAIYRGRRDFVYRIAVGLQTDFHKLLLSGWRGGVWFGPDAASITAPASIDTTAFPAWQGLARVPEMEPNNSREQANQVTLPQAWEGSISIAGDVDYYRFEGKAGQIVVADVLARRNGSGLDSLLQLLDANGQVLAWNDDTEDKSLGLLTHHADSYLRFTLPEPGTYILAVSDVRGHGHVNYTYSLRVSAPMPNFALQVSPSASDISTGRAAILTVDVVRYDGWDGEIAVALQGAPTGYVLDGAKIPPGRSQIRMTLTTSATALQRFELVGRATIAGQTVTHAVKPTDKMMQAFAYYHNVPTQNTQLALIRSSRTGPEMSLVQTGVTQIPAGKTAQIRVRLQPMPQLPMRVELREPPAGIFLQEVKVLAEEVVLVISADSKQMGYADNLIVEIFTETLTPGVGDAPAVTKSVSIGVLPAIPIKVVP